MGDREAVDAVLSELDLWCQKRGAAIREELSAWVLDGGDLRDPDYRRGLGRGDAYLAARSFISATRKVNGLHNGRPRKATRP